MAAMKIMAKKKELNFDFSIPSPQSAVTGKKNRRLKKARFSRYSHL